jgi:hypothetical protein
MHHISQQYDDSKGFVVTVVSHVATGRMWLDTTELENHGIVIAFHLIENKGSLRLSFYA